MPATLEPPPSAAPQITSIAPAPGAPAPTSSPKPSIAPSTSRPTAPTPPTTKKPSERSFDDLREFAAKDKAKPEIKPEAPVKEAKPPEVQKTEDEAKPPTADKSDKKPETAEAKVEGEAEPQKQGKVWKILKETETKLATVQKEYEDFKSKAQIDPDKEKQVSERIKAMEKREQELVEDLRFHNYEKYDEDFKKNYETPYRSAWDDAVLEITQLPVTLEDGSVRAGTASDLSALMDLPTVEQHEMAERMFGKFSNDALREAKEVKRLFNKRRAALDEAKKTLGEKDAKRREEAQNYHKTVSEEVGKVWQEADKEAFSHEKYGEYFQPKEGDQEGNQRLAKGRALAQRAFTENPFDRKLTPSDRATVVKRQNAVCNRAAAFGRLVAWNKAKDTRIAELEKEVGQYKNGEPGGGEGQQSETAVITSPSQRANRDLMKLAH